MPNKSEAEPKLEDNRSFCGHCRTRLMTDYLKWCNTCGYPTGLLPKPENRRRSQFGDLYSFKAKPDADHV